jgi:hypothetical protein
VCLPRTLRCGLPRPSGALRYIYLFGREPILIFYEKVAHDFKSVKNAMSRTEALCIGMKAI